MQDNQNQALSTDSSRPTTDQAHRMITDLWGAMIALFGVRWSSQFGETPDASGQWRQTLSGISRQQVADALSDIRSSGRAWPPTAPEFRAMCLSAGKPKSDPLEVAWSEFNRWQRTGSRDYSHVSPALYHTINKNLDMYVYQQQSRQEVCLKMFEMAYKATLFQIECGEELRKPPAPETLIESKPVLTPKTDEQIAKGSEIIGSLLAMFDDKPEDKQLTQDEINDLQRLEKLNGKRN